MTKKIEVVCGQMGFSETDIGNKNTCKRRRNSLVKKRADLSMNKTQKTNLVLLIC